MRVVAAVGKVVDTGSASLLAAHPIFPLVMMMGGS